MINLSGTYFEIGKKLGKIYNKKNLNLTNVCIQQAQLNSQLKIYRKYYPKILEEIHGISLAGKFDEEKILYALLLEEIDAIKKFHLPLCTVLGVKNKNGIFVGRNLDSNPNTEKIFKIIIRESKEFNKYIGICDLFTGGPDKNFYFYEYLDVINNKGLYATVTYAYNSNWTYGISWEHMLRLIAETCSKVDDVINLFNSVPVSNPKNFFIADKEGRMIVIEHTSKKFRIVYPQDNLLIKTNHYLHKDLINDDRVLIEKPEHNTFLRYAETLKNVKKIKEILKIEDIIKILGKVDSCVCQNSTNIKTVWTVVLDMKRKKYKLYTDVINSKKERPLVI